MADSGDANIKVVVRCRPLNSRELARGAKPLIRMSGNQTFLDPPEAGSEQATSSGGRAAERKTMPFSFDKSYWSAGDRNDPEYCSQQTLYDDLGKELLDHGFSGFNACILAYGQTGSGKSYSMMGYGADKGIIPLTCSELFVRTQDKEERDSNLKFTVEVSYIEASHDASILISIPFILPLIQIYNEKVRDLLNPKNKGNLKVREHPSLGPYVEDLSRLVVSSYEDMMTLMDEGNKARTVAATNMNETSSRSHAVFTLLLTMKRHDPETNLDTEKVSRINLVDLAGSERANSTGATGQRLKEGANINKSLTTLGKVISALALASQSDGKSKGKKKAEDFIPYRDSVLTWLLKDSLGGNSKTAMIAAISPADYDETLSTLRYADQAKKIKNKAVVNEDPNAKLVRELKEELEMLRARVAGSANEDTWDPKVPPEKQVVTFMSGDGTIKKVTKAELQEQLETSEKLMQNLNETWEEKLVRTQEVQKEREKALEELGITVEKNNVGVHTPKKTPHLVNLNEDPLMSECLVYQLRPGRTMVGRLDDEKPADIRLSGDNILEEHCYFDNMDGKVTLTTLVESTTFLNGKQVTVGQPYKLRSGYRLILGHHHVFRFNDPEAVRKQRSRANKSSMSQSTTAADLDQAPTRPESPVSDAVGDVDWTYAQREVAYARLGLDPALDSLPDEDLNNLFERITKVKTLRDHNAKPSRPESSLSQADDVWSEFCRPVPNDALTDDTSVDNGASASQTSPEIHELQGQLEAQKIEYESRLQAISESSEAEDIVAEKEQMEHQLKLVQKHMKRLLEMRAQGAVDAADFVAFDPIIYSAKQLRLIRKVLERWRAHRSFSMAESVLSHAVLVKEANVLSKELKKDVTYNFAIATGGTLAKTMSAHETIAGLDQFEDVADPILASATQPSVAIKVIDKRHNALYLWSLDRLQQRLQKMRNLTAFVDRPAYSVHFAAEEPFYDSPPPEYSFIGNALISLAPLSRKLSSTATVPIFCRYTAEAIGSCRVDLKVVNVTLPPNRSGNGSAASTRPSSPMPGTLPAGSKLSFFLTVDHVKGLSSHDFTAVHIQVRLSSFIGPSRPTEEMYVSTVVDMDKGVLSDLKFRRSFSLQITSKTAAFIRTGYAPIEFFAKTQPVYLERIERWDEMREQRGAVPSRIKSPSEATLTMRRSETDFVVEEHHDVVAWLQVCELAADGDYAPVPVVSQGSMDPGSFMLHQGLQRRIVLRLQSNSGRQFPWTRVLRMKVGNIRLLDAKGRIHESTSKELVDLVLLKDQFVEFPPDGSGILTVNSLWDSSAHDSSLLNRVTAANQRILLQTHFYVMVDTCLDPIHFKMDMAITMAGRDARPPSTFLSFIGTSKLLSKTTAVFNVKLTPPLTRSPKDLWRLDTSEKYVHGEDVLGSFKPRGVSVVNDYTRLISTEKRAADVQAIKVVLAAAPPPPPSDWLDKDEILTKSLALWQKHFGSNGEIVLTQEPPLSEPKHKFGEKIVDQTLKFVSNAALMPRIDSPIKKGHLMLLTNANENIWEKRWFVIRRPYLHVYLRSNELDESGVVCLNGANIENNPEMEVLFGRRFMFTLFTPSNSYALQAPSMKELQSWISKLDPTRIFSQ